MFACLLANSFSSLFSFLREVAEKNILIKMTDEEQERQNTVGQVEDILGRRLEGRVLKYECSFVGMSAKHNR